MWLRYIIKDTSFLKGGNELDYKINYEFIKENGNVTNMDEPYMLFYDETNNPRTFRLTKTGFNVNESEYFILGGVGFKTVIDADAAPVDKLFHDLRLQSNASEIKFKHIQQNAKDFFSLMTKPKVRCFLDWLASIDSAFIHYSFVDNFYYAIVDIVDSTEEYWFMGPEFNRELKDRLYSLIKGYKDWFIDLLIEVDYPNIKNHQYFITQVVEWLWTVNISEDFHLEYLRQSLKSYRNKGLVIANEVATMLGYVNPRKAVYDHVDEEDKGVTKWNTPGGIQNISIINESGLYSLILSSKLPQAKIFKAWVTREVLPSIRKNGGYIVGQEKKTNEELLADAILVDNRIIAEREEKIEELRPKADYYDKLVDYNLLTNFRNTAKELGIPQNQFISFLMDKGLIYRDKKKKLLPYADKNKGYFEVKEWVDPLGTLVGIQTFITPKGRHYLLILLDSEGFYDE